MTPEMTIRAWKDSEFRARLGVTAPTNPAGSSEVQAAELAGDVYITSPACTIGPRCSEGPRCPD